MRAPSVVAAVVVTAVAAAAGCAFAKPPWAADDPDAGAGDDVAPDAASPDAARLDAATPDAASPADATIDAAVVAPDAALHDPVGFAPLAGDFGGLAGYLHVPPGLPVGEPRPLVVVLHGCWEDAAVHAANGGWNQLADARGFVTVHAEEASQVQQCFDWWSAEAQAGGGDAAGVVAMIDAAAAAVDVDPDRVYLAGFSSGAALVVDLLAVHPGRFAGAVVDAALPYRGYTGTDVGALGYFFTEHDETPAARAAVMPGPGPYPPVIAIVGTADATVHPSFTRELVDQWTAAQGADQTPEVEGRLDPGHAGHVYREYRDGDGRLLIATVTVDGMAHGYPVAPTGVAPARGGGTAASLPGRPVYGKDVGLWGAYWAAIVLGL
ncbi:MAG: PHB depolymerase family esterase [Kofleriaceae bacterium]|nr:PHB depolymerase family esterase [Kofleriaceae bacterium]